MFGKINVFYLLLAIYLFIFIICYILENMDNYIFYDEKAETENGFPIVHGMMVDEDHHDVLSTLDQYINSEDEYTVRVRFDEDDYMYIEFQLDDGIIEIDENGWYVA